jgi:hypothetical protein
MIGGDPKFVLTCTHTRVPSHPLTPTNTTHYTFLQRLAKWGSRWDYSPSSHSPKERINKEGNFPVSTISNDNYEYEERRLHLIGKGGEKKK